MIGNPQNYQTQRIEAQKYGTDAVNNAKAYVAALQAAGGDKTKLSAQGIAARGNVIKALKKEIATLGQGGYNDVDEESFESLMQDLASGKFVPNSMLPIDKTYKQRRAESIANTGVINRPTSNVYSSPVSSKQPATTKTNALNLSWIFRIPRPHIPKFQTKNTLRNCLKTPSFSTTTNN